MARRSKNRNRNKRHRGLFGVTAGEKASYMDTAKDGGLMVLTAIAAVGVGAAIGKHSLLVGLPVTLVGVHKKNKFIIAAGLGLALSNGFQKQGSSTVQGVDGFDLKQIAQDAKDRVGTFFENFKGKLYMPSAPVAIPATTTDGIDDDKVSYFVNPYNGTGELDTSELDRIQEQIAEMNKEVSGVNEIDREF